MWQLSRAVQRPGRHAGAQEKLLQNEIHVQVKIKIKNNDNENKK